jgi:hypothetical protein
MKAVIRTVAPHGLLKAPDTSPPSSGNTVILIGMANENLVKLTKYCEASLDGFP